MATIRKRKDKYVVIYDYINEKGVRKQKWETCESKADASRRAKEVEYEKSRNNLIAPNNQTVAEFLAEWAPIQAKKCWQYKTYMTNMQMIEMHINPLIGKVKMQKLSRLNPLLYEVPSGSNVQPLLSYVPFLLMVQSLVVWQPLAAWELPSQSQAV